MQKFTVKDAIGFLMKYVHPYKKHFFAFYAGWLLETVVSIFIPKILGIMLDTIVYQQNIADFLKASLVVVLLMVYSCILYYWLYAQHHYLMIMFTFQIKIAVFEKFLKLHPKKRQELSTGEIMAVIQDYPAECMHFLIRGVIHQINNFIIIAVLLVFSFRMNLLLGSLMVCLAFGCGVITILFGKQSKASSVKEQKVYGKYIGWLYEILENFISIRLMGAQKSVEDKYYSYSKNLFKEKNRMNLFQEGSDQIIKGVILISELCIFALSAYLMEGNMLSIGAFTVVLAYFNRLSNTVTDINQKWNDAQTRAGFIEKICDFLKLPDEADRGKKTMGYCHGEIQIENLQFSYGMNQIFHDFCLHIKAKEKIGIVGASGCGKSTLADLLTGLLKPDAGKIEIDGVNIKEYSLKSLRSKVGIMYQDALFVDGSIRENLLFGKKNASKAEMMEALKNAGLQKYINDLPEGLDSHTCNEMSGGQKQRLAIARIILEDPDIIILDEPTSALDSGMEQRIMAGLIELFQDKTMIIITHRRETAELCDRVIRL